MVYGIFHPRCCEALTRYAHRVSCVAQRAVRATGRSVCYALELQICNSFSLSSSPRLLCVQPVKSQRQSSPAAQTLSSAGLRVVQSLGASQSASNLQPHGNSPVQRPVVKPLPKPRKPKRVAKSDPEPKSSYGDDTAKLQGDIKLYQDKIDEVATELETVTKEASTIEKYA